MKREEALAVCSYYHGEEENPFRVGTPSAGFWRLEETFCHGLYNDPLWGSDRMLLWLKGISNKAFEFVNRFDNPNKRLMLASMCMGSYDHDPMGGVDFILEYGKTKKDDYEK